MGDLKFALLLAVCFVVFIFNCSAGGSLVPLAARWDRGVPELQCSSFFDFFDFEFDQNHHFFFNFILEKPATRPRDRCGKEQLVYPFVTGSPGSSRVSALAPYSSGGRVGSTLSTPHAGGDVGLFVW